MCVGVRCSANRMRFVHLVLEHLGIQMPDKGYLNWSVGTNTPFPLEEQDQESHMNTEQIHKHQHAERRRLLH